MKNREVADILYQMAELLELQAENRFKIIAYSKAARAIEGLPEDIATVSREGRLQAIPGVGRAIADKVEEYLKTGRIAAHQELLAKTPPAWPSCSRSPASAPRRSSCSMTS